MNQISLLVPIDLNLEAPKLITCRYSGMGVQKAQCESDLGILLVCLHEIECCYSVEHKVIILKKLSSHYRNLILLKY